MTPARLRRAWGLAMAATLVALVGGCATERKPPSEPPATQIGPPTSGTGAGAPGPPGPPGPPSPDSVPDAVPRVEPRSRYGNPPFYEVFGKRYYVLSSSADYVERGVASWYGPGFHQVNTSTQEPYDMYAMTAAHKTLPLPAYVRVTNLQNGRSVVVRVNDRGPFVGNRLIDLSYTAAAKLDMLKNGTAMVEVRSIDPTAATTAAATATATAPIVAAAAPATTPATVAPAARPAVTAAPVAAAPVAGAPVAAPPSNAAAKPVLFVQAGAFADPKNADKLMAKLQGGGFGKLFVRDDLIAGRRMYRVRIGPVPDVPAFDRIVAALEQLGVHDAHLASE